MGHALYCIMPDGAKAKIALGGTLMDGEELKSLFRKAQAGDKEARESLLGSDKLECIGFESRIPFRHFVPGPGFFSVAREDVLAISDESGDVVDFYALLTAPVHDHRS